MRDFLLVKGFTPDPEQPECFTLAHVRLKDAAEALGFSLASLRVMPSLPYDTDIRTVVVRGWVFNVVSDDWVAGSCPRFVAEPDTLCTIGVSLTPGSIYRAPMPPLPTDSSPRLRIKSVTLAKSGHGQFRIAFEVSVDGTQPLVLARWQFKAYLFREGARLFRETLDFPSGAGETVTVRPGGPLVLTAGVPVRATTLGRDRVGSTPGVYSLRVVIAGDPGMKGKRLDYMWLGGKPGKREVSSDDFEIRIPGSAAAKGAAPGEREMGDH
jgi:hypothetical protein